MMAEAYDIAIVGAGPAGMAAAAATGQLGLTAIVLDEQHGPGGQVYNSIETGPFREGTLGKDYGRGRVLALQFRASGADYRPGAQVWHIDAGPQGWQMVFSQGGRAERINARQVILATGAVERPFPIPGWTLPGVMTAGAAQILLKSAGIASGGAVFAGCGPLLYLVAAQYLRVGINVRTVLDTTPPRQYRMAVPALFRAMGNSPALAKGLGMMLHIRRAGVPFITGVEALSAEGAGRVAAVRYRAHGREHRLEDISHLFLHHGVVPNIHLALAAGCTRIWDSRQCAWTIACDRWGRTSRLGLFVAGDAAGILGAIAAPHRGRLAALAAAAALRRIPPAKLEQETDAAEKPLAREIALRRFLDILYRPAEAFRIPADDTIVCRCEEIATRAIRNCARHGDADPNPIKSLIRCGMGPCQGRMCGTTVTEILAEACGVPAAETGYFSVRPPINPVSFAELAALGVAEEPGR
jgi:thioredoxin reductase